MLADRSFVTSGASRGVAGRWRPGELAICGAPDALLRLAAGLIAAADRAEGLRRSGARPAAAAAWARTGLGGWWRGRDGDRRSARPRPRARRRRDEAAGELVALVRALRAWRAWACSTRRRSASSGGCASARARSTTAAGAPRSARRRDDRGPLKPRVAAGWPELVVGVAGAVALAGRAGVARRRAAGVAAVGGRGRARCRRRAGRGCWRGCGRRRRRAGCWCGRCRDGGSGAGSGAAWMDAGLPPVALGRLRRCRPASWPRSAWHRAGRSRTSTPAANGWRRRSACASCASRVTPPTPRAAR